MLVLTVASERRKPAGSKATSAEVEALFRSMTSYGGTYTYPSGRLVIDVPIPSALPEARERGVSARGIRGRGGAT
jgi:hypothetical protein